MADSLPTLVFLLLLGLVWGSFLNVLIHRLPVGESVVRPRSRCPACGAGIRWRDNLPLVSWVLLRGRCRDCGGAISVRYPLVEVLAAAVVVSAPFADGVLAAPSWVVFLSLLLALAACDLEQLLLPDALTLPGAALGLGFAAVRPEVGLTGAILGAALGAGLLLGLRALWLWLRGVEAVGRGDIKMLLMVGAFLGPAATLTAIALASGLGIVIALPLLVTGRMGRQTRIPFGALLAAGAAAVFVLAPGAPLP